MTLPPMAIRTAHGARVVRVPVLTVLLAGLVVDLPRGQRARVTIGQVRHLFLRNNLDGPAGAARLAPGRAPPAQPPWPPPRLPTRMCQHWRNNPRSTCIQLHLRVCIVRQPAVIAIPALRVARATAVGRDTGAAHPRPPERQQVRGLRGAARGANAQGRPRLRAKFRHPLGIPSQKKWAELHNAGQPCGTRLMKSSNVATIGSGSAACVRHTAPSVGVDVKVIFTPSCIFYMEIR
jgi:hypothetical protein